jgi:uncharacterized protein (TIGR02678 family)
MRRLAIPEEREAQFRRAVRALLARPLLLAGQADNHDFRLVRTHAAQLRAWFDREAGWRLQIDAHSARLFKTAKDSDDTRPARDSRSHVPFGRRRYVLLCLALAVLERAETQTTLGRLADELLVAMAEPDLAAAGISFSLDRRDERADLVAVARLLLDWGALRRVHGDEEAYLGHAGDVLYDVDRRVVATLIATGRGPSTVTASTFDERLAALTAEPRPETEELRNRSLRHALTRRLLEDPVVYFDDLTSDELAYLRSQRTQIIGRIADATGLVAEIRAEGIALVDPDDQLTDVRMPAQGMQSHLTLLLAEFIASRPDGVRISELQGHTRALAQRFQKVWRKDATTVGAEQLLVHQAVEALRALRLVVVSESAVSDGADPLVTGRPAISRYALAEPRMRSAESTMESA